MSQTFRDIYLLADSSAAMINYLKDEKLVIDASASVTHHTLPDGLQVSEGVSIYYFAPGRFLVEKATFDRDGNETKAAVLDTTNTYANIRIDDELTRLRPDIKVFTEGTKTTRTSRFPKGRGGKDYQAFQVNTRGGNVRLIEEPKNKRQVWAGDPSPEEHG